MDPSYCSSLKNSSPYANNRDEEDASSIVVVIVKRPEHEAGKLKDVEWVKGLNWLT